MTPQKPTYKPPLLAPGTRPYRPPSASSPVQPPQGVPVRAPPAPLPPPAEQAAPAAPPGPSQSSAAAEPSFTNALLSKLTAAAVAGSSSSTPAAAAPAKLVPQHQPPLPAAAVIRNLNTASTARLSSRGSAETAAVAVPDQGTGHASWSREHPSRTAGAPWPLAAQQQQQRHVG